MIFLTTRNSRSLKWNCYF